MSDHRYGDNDAKKQTDDMLETAKSVGRSVYDQGKTIAKGAQDYASAANTKMKSMGVDSDAMIDAAKEKGTDLQKLIASEVRARPYAALAVAAFVGMWFGSRMRGD